MSKTIETRFAPHHKALTEGELTKLRKKKRINISIDAVTGYQLRHTTARMGIIKKISYDSIIRLLLLGYRKGQFKTLMDTDEAKRIVGE